MSDLDPRHFKHEFETQTGQGIYCGEGKVLSSQNGSYNDAYVYWLVEKLANGVTTKDSGLHLQRVSGSFLDELIEKHTANKKLALENCKKMKDSDQYPWYDATFNNELLFVHDLEDLKSRSGL